MNADLRQNDIQLFGNQRDTNEMMIHVIQPH